MGGKDRDLCWDEHTYTWRGMDTRRTEKPRGVLSVFFLHIPSSTCNVDSMLLLPVAKTTGTNKVYNDGSPAPFVRFVAVCVLYRIGGTIRPVCVHGMSAYLADYSLQKACRSSCMAGICGCDWSWMHVSLPPPLSSILSPSQPSHSSTHKPQTHILFPLSFSHTKKSASSVCFLKDTRIYHLHLLMVVTM